MQAANRAQAQQIQQLQQAQQPPLDQMTLEQRLEGVDLTDPAVEQALLGRWLGPEAAQSPMQPQSPPQVQLPEGTDPAMAQLFQQQQQMFQQTIGGLQQQLAQLQEGQQQVQQQVQGRQQQEQEHAHQQQQMGQFAQRMQQDAAKWSTYRKAMDAGLPDGNLGFALAVGDEMVKQTGGVPVSFDMVLDACDRHFQQYAALHAPPQQPPTQQKPAQPAAAPAQGADSTTLGDATSDTPTPRQLTSEEKVAKATQIVLDKQRARKDANKRQ
jgi:hypothetical protein